MTEILTIVISLLTLIIGGGGLLFYKQTKRLRIAEAAAAEKDIITKDLENQKTTNDEWIRLYDETKSELNETRERLNNALDDARSKIMELNQKLQTAIEIESHQRLVINDLTWSKCVVNGCSNRKPPREFEEKLKQIENMHTDIMSRRLLQDLELEGDEEVDK